MHIRPFADRDYAAVAEINTLIMPDQPITGQLLARLDAQREPHLLYGRWVAEEEGRLVGVAGYGQWADVLVPGEVYVYVRVHPAFQRRGFGAALYDALIDRLRRVGADSLKITLRSDRFPGINFAMRRGFIEYARRIESRLDLAAFDAAAFPDPDAQMAEQGLQLRSVADLAADPQRDQKLYDLKWEIEQDIPYPGRITRPSLPAFQTQYLNSPSFAAAGSFVAVDGDNYAGLVFHESASPSLLMVELTGTARAYRRRGIAQALKLRSMVWAKAAGYTTMLVNNDLANVGMLAINDKLGYVRQPALILLQRKAPF